MEQLLKVKTPEPKNPGGYKMITKNLLVLKMQISKNLIFCILLFCTIGCQDKASKGEKGNTKDIAEVQKQKTGSTKSNEIKGYIKESMVISCGSGCAMSYSPDEITPLEAAIKVKFRVEMYIDEVVSDTYSETYIFSYNKSDNLEKVQQEGKPENILENLMPAAQDSFRKFGENLIVNKNKTILSFLINYKQVYDDKTKTNFCDGFKTIINTSDRLCCQQIYWQTNQARREQNS